MKTFCFAAFLVLCSCGTSETQTDTGTSTAGGNGSTTGASVIGNTGSTTGGSGTFVATANEPIQPATYSVDFTRNYDYTTCNLSMCDGDFSIDYKLDYNGNGSYLITSPATSWTVPVTTATLDGKNYRVLNWKASDRSGTSAAGCPGTLSGNFFVIPDPHQIIGAFHVNWYAQACNGYASYACTCAYDMLSSSFSKAHSLQMPSVSPDIALELMR